MTRPVTPSALITAAAARRNACSISRTMRLRNTGSWLRASARSVARSATTLVALPARNVPTLLVPLLPSFSILPCQPPRSRSAMARAAMAMALTPRSGAAPAWLAKPCTSISMR